MYQRYLSILILSFFTFAFGYGKHAGHAPSPQPSTFELPPVWLSAPYPNPAKKFTTVEYQLPTGVIQAEIRIYNLIGKEIQVQKVTEVSGKLTLQTHQLKAGVYVIYLVVDNKPLTSRKLIVS
ncbi:MAG: T9SS C-terminal target domain-containing protein [Bacteroidetes bacterium]|nr:MAG: T9SS C-terminal target domain-containing protein [Bacteroidota bacterium]